jgi:hypothetical protein
MVDKPKIRIKRYLIGLGGGSKSWIGFDVIVILECKNDCKIRGCFVSCRAEERKEGRC